MTASAEQHSDVTGPSARFVQDRLAFFGKIIFFISFAFIGVSTVEVLRGADEIGAPGRVPHVIATLVAFGTWQLARRMNALAPSALSVLDAAGTLGITLCLVVMGHRFAERTPWGYFSGVFAVFHVVIARAVLVPSTPRRTLLVTALAFAGLIVSHYLLSSTIEVHQRLVELLGPMTWATSVTALATVASKVIFGLHAQVQQARRLGQYTLEEKIGQGGMGEVYRARHAMLRRPTAIKLLSGNVAERELRRFEKEVQLTAELGHPNTISIYDYGRTPDGTFYYVMELLQGVTLQELVDTHGAQPQARVIHILRQVCAALREAHGAGLIHRDIKPDNVFLCRHGGLPDVVKVLDFGLVKHLATDAEATRSNVDVIVGTPLYMSPEAIATPERVDARSDLYALGAVAYFLLSGTSVFSGQSVIEVCGHHLHSTPEPLARRTPAVISADLERVVMDCLAKDPEQRPGSAAELATRLERLAEAGTWSEADAESRWQTNASRRKSTQGESALASRTIEIAVEERLARGAAD